ANKTDSDSVATASMAKAGLISGEANLNADMSRLQVARLLAKAFKVSAKAIDIAADYPFKDFGLVPAEDRGILKALYDLGIFKGYPDKTFGPNDILTKAQIAILVDRILGAQAK
ncbi:MAG: S-layer homology domain-containing protein, partial [Bacillota bacterium]